MVLTYLLLEYNSHLLSISLVDGEGLIESIVVWKSIVNLFKISVSGLSCSQELNLSKVDISCPGASCSHEHSLGGRVWGVDNIPSINHHRFVNGQSMSHNITLIVTITFLFILIFLGRHSIGNFDFLFTFSWEVNCVHLDSDSSKLCRSCKIKSDVLSFTT